MMRLRGKDRRKSAANEDIDLTRLGIPPKRYTRIDYRHYWDVKRAKRRHASQGGGQMGFSQWIQIWDSKAPSG